MIVSRAILAPTSVTPVASIRTSIFLESVTTFESSVTTKFPCAIHSSASHEHFVYFILSSLTPACSKAFLASSVFISTTIAGFIPSIRYIWLTIP